MPFYGITSNGFWLCSFIKQKQLTALVSRMSICLNVNKSLTHIVNLTQNGATGYYVNTMGGVIYFIPIDLWAVFEGNVTFSYLF